MARRIAKEMTVEEYDAWSGARARVATVADNSDEDGGPRLSLVPLPDQPPLPAMPFDGVPLEDSRNRLAGWSADRQRLFLTHLAETGSVHLACGSARLSARGAYRLRARSPAFARGWDMAQRLSVGRLSAIAFDRALNGRHEQVYRDGELGAERRVPNDKLLMWLLARLDPKRFDMPWAQRCDADPQAEAVAAFPALLDAITDTAAE